MNEGIDNDNKGVEISDPALSNNKTLESPGYVQEPEPAGPMNGGEKPLGFLELVFGVLFEPVKTMKKVAAKPPLGLSVLIVAAVSLISVIMFIGALGKGPNPALTGRFAAGLWSLVPLVAFMGVFIGFLKWFGYSAILHLMCDLLGGKGSARSVFAAAGLAGLPSIFMVPVQVICYWIGEGSTAATVLAGLFGLAVLIWSVIILVIGLKQVHGLSTGRTVLVVFTPTIIMILLIFIVVIALAAVVAQWPSQMNLPGYF